MVQSLNQPLNYTLNVPNPAEAVTAGLQQGVQLASMMERTDALAAQKQQTLLENQALQAKASRAKAFQDELGKMTAEGFTAKGLNELMIRFPEAAKQLEAQYTNLGTQERQARVDALLPVAAAVNAGDSVSAQLVLRDQIGALTNSGKTDEAKAASRMLDLITTNPAAAKSTLNLATAGAMGMDKYADTLVKIEGSRREEELQPSKLSKAQSDALKSKFEADVAGVKAEFASEQERAELNVKKASSSNMYSQITDRAKRLGLDERKFADESARAWTNLGLDRARLSQLPEPIRKEIDTYVVKAGEASTDAARMREIARRYREEVTTGGLQASAGELYARLTGKTDAISDLRAEYARMRNTQVLKNLPPGPASDKDIAFAAKGFPDENANPQQVSAFLTGFAKIRELEAKQNEARAAWTSTFRGLGNATAEANVGGVQVQAGEKFNDFVKRYQGSETAAAPAGRAPAAAPAADVRAQADAILRGGK
jgi:hypothetical protein